MIEGLVFLNTWNQLLCHVLSGKVIIMGRLGRCFISVCIFLVMSLYTTQGRNLMLTVRYICSKLGRELKSFRTKYKILGDFPAGQRGLTFRRQMIKTPTKYREMTICFRIKMGLALVKTQFH